jgi:hypothetical protein
VASAEAESAAAALDALVGEWEMEIEFSGMPPMGGARTTFERMGPMLVQRWEIPVPEAPDGIAVYGYDDGRGTLLQHYFDERGVARVYEMTLADGLWTLERTKEDFSALSFSQRFRGEFSDDDDEIRATWEIAHDHKTFEKDFDLTYRRVGE